MGRSAGAVLHYVDVFGTSAEAHLGGGSTTSLPPQNGSGQGLEHARCMTRHPFEREQAIGRARPGTHLILARVWAGRDLVPI
jgi:hypothetical protein